MELVRGGNLGDKCQKVIKDIKKTVYGSKFQKPVNSACTYCPNTKMVLGDLISGTYHLDTRINPELRDSGRSWLVARAEAEPLPEPSGIAWYSFRNNF